MSDPTRVQIEATVTLPTYTVEYYNAGWVAVSDDDIESIDGLSDTGGGSSGLDFGANASPRITVNLDDTTTTAAIAWTKTRVRVKYGFAGSNELVRMAGLIVGRSRETGLAVKQLKWECAGFDELIRDTPLFSPMFYRRLPATRTTISSVEDPTNGGYQAGLINYIFWQAGGRPFEQSATYTTAVFYYQCDNAMIAPEWTWAAGEDGWSELDRLCRAIGGQVFQQPDGTMRYVNVLAPTASGYAIDESDYESIQQEETTGDYFVAARCSYTARALQPPSIVYEDTTPRTVAPSGTLTFTVEPQLPVYEWIVSSGTTIPTDCYVATDYFGIALTPTATYVSRAAGRAELSFVNTDTTKAMIISRVSLKGRAVAPIETGQAKYGSGTPEKLVGDGEIYVQSRTHAERLCRMYVDVYGVIRATRICEGMGYDPDRFLGEVITLTNSELALSAVTHRIVSIQVNETGALMDMALAPLTGIPLASEMFIIGGIFSSGDVRQLGY